MFANSHINKHPTVFQVNAIIEYMKKAGQNKYDFTNVIDMVRSEENKILLGLGNDHHGRMYEVLFNQNEIESFKEVGVWMY
jgi:hypothetical protein